MVFFFFGGAPYRKVGVLFYVQGLEKRLLPGPPRGSNFRGSLRYGWGSMSFRTGKKVGSNLGK